VTDERTTAVVRLGGFFFRWRSYLPLLLLPVFAVAIARFHLLFRSHVTDLVWEIGCLLLALAGVALRAYTVGVAAPGTSGRNTREQKAASLNTTGPYSVVRHPLYLANGVIIVALALFTHTWVAPPLVMLLTAGYYACIVRREEEYLRARFGRPFTTWRARVPAALPDLSGYVPPARPFAWKVVARREFYALALVLVVPMFLDVAEDLVESGSFDLDPVWTATAAVGAALFVVLRFLKKHTAVLVVKPPAPAAASGRDEGARA
jgi:protein-S-isoprenylcysteine O-methyltransferase Ste14